MDQNPLILKPTAPISQSGQLWWAGQQVNCCKGSHGSTKVSQCDAGGGGFEGFWGHDEPDPRATRGTKWDRRNLADLGWAVPSFWSSVPWEFLLCLGRQCRCGAPMATKNSCSAWGKWCKSVAGDAGCDEPKTWRGRGSATAYFVAKDHSKQFQISFPFQHSSCFSSWLAGEHFFFHFLILWSTCPAKLFFFWWKENGAAAAAAAPVLPVPTEPTEEPAIAAELEDDDAKALREMMAEASQCCS